MFAFSQVIAGEGTVGETVQEIEQEAKNIKLKEQEDKKLWEQALEAQKKAEAEKKPLSKEEEKQHKEAMAELQNLKQNEGTAALAALQEA